MLRGSPVSSIMARVTASSTTHGHAEPRRAGTVPRGPVSKTCQERRSWASTMKGIQPQPWMIGRWTIWPAIGPPKA